MFENTSLWAPSKGIVISKSVCEMQANILQQAFLRKNHENWFWG